jgi:integrase
MGAPGKKTAAEYIPWEDLTYFINCLERDGHYRLCLLASLCSFWALRIGDALSLKWVDLFVLGQNDVKDIFILDEQKNQLRRKKEGKAPKLREIPINKDIKGLILRIFKQMQTNRKTDFIFLNYKGDKVFSEQYVNRRLKELAKKYRLQNSNISSHSFRKSFGRKVLQENSFSPESKELLMKIYGHGDWSITREYLGFTRDEISNIYGSLKLA